MRLPRFVPALRRAAVVCAALCAVQCGVLTSPAQAQPISGVIRADIDPHVRAQDDFYTHANGRWLKRAAIPADKPYIGPVVDVQDRTRAQLRALIEAPANAAPTDPDAARVTDLYVSFMNEAATARLGVTPLESELAGIQALNDRSQLGALFAHLGPLGVDLPLAIGIGQDDRDATRYVPQLAQSGLGLPTRDYYLKLADPTFRKTRASYVDYLARVFALALGRPRATPETTAGARAVLALETEIARGQWTPVENRDPVKGYNRVALDGLSALAPSFSWSEYLAGAGLAGRTPDLLVRQPSYVQALDGLIASTPLAIWKAYLRARVLDAYAPYLSPAFDAAHFDFHGKVLDGTLKPRPRWQRGIRLVDESLGEALGRRYVAAHFPPESKRRIEAMVQNLLGAYRDSLTTLDWMSPETRTQALAKLDKIQVKVGYPVKWIDYSALAIQRDDLVGNVMRARRFEDARQRAKLGQPIDRAEWQMTPQTINAYYDPSMNEIVFPAAFLQPPFFVAEADDAINYGAVGQTIGHEISHAFDDNGAQYDADGNLRDWWTADDKARFKARTALLVKQYSAIVAIPPAYHVDGELTLGENIADNAGLVMTYKAWQRSLGGRPSPVIDGWSGDQRFMYSYAQSSRSKTRRASLLAQIKSDPHAPDDVRVTEPLRNLPAFYSAFGVRPGDRMYLGLTHRFGLW